MKREIHAMKIVLAVLCFLSFGVFTAAADIAKKDSQIQASIAPELEGTLKNNLTKLGLTAVSIAKSPVDGLYQVITDRGLFYFSENGRYLVHGKVYDLKDDIEDISELALAQSRIDGVKRFDGQMIVYPAKNEKYKVTVFTDTTCGYCRKLHAQMAGYNDLGITVQYLAFPRSGINGPTFKELKAVWCADDQAKALTEAKNGTQKNMSNGTSCDAPIAEQYALGMQVGVSGTPAIIFDDGTMIPGYQPPAELFSALEKNKQKS